MNKISSMTRRKKLSLLGLIILVIAMVLVALEATGRINIIGATPVIDNTSKTTSDAPSAQTNFKADEPKEPAPTAQKTETAVNDTGGSSQPQATSAPLVSKDGAITVYTPASNAKFSSGSALIGKSNATTVSYRLADDISGVTATGSLKVVNGGFSGTFNFSTNATQGRLDVFQTGAGGVEKSIIEIPVRFR